MTIRKLKKTESDFSAEMLYYPLPKKVIKDKSLSKYIENWGKDKFDIALVVETDNELVGAIWGRLLTDENRGFGYVDGSFRTSWKISGKLAGTFVFSIAGIIIHTIHPAGSLANITIYLYSSGNSAFCFMGWFSFYFTHLFRQGT